MTITLGLGSCTLPAHRPVSVFLMPPHLLQQMKAAVESFLLAKELSFSVCNEGEPFTICKFSSRFMGTP